MAPQLDEKGLDMRAESRGADVKAMAGGGDGKEAALARHSWVDWLALVMWMGWLHILLATLLVIALTFPHPIALALLLLLATLSVTPVDVEGRLAKAYRRFIYPVVLRHFPVRVLFLDPTTITFGKPYVVGLEPHSVLPIGLAALMEHPMFVHGYAGATSALFRVPLLRQFWQWVRTAPATRPTLTRLLKRGCTVVIIPGGVQECVFMAPGREVAFVRQRFGFIRLALEQGVPVVPCFVFGQTTAYHWWKPQGAWYRAMARRMGFAPIVFWGMWGSPIPLRNPITIVFGKPIAGGHPDPNPSKERVVEVHAEYVAALEHLFLTYRAEAGFPHTELQIM